IVRRKLSAWRSSQSRHARGSGNTETHRLLEQYPASEAGLDAEWEAEWQRRLFDWASTQVQQQVTAATWQAFWRTAVDGLPARQVAADLGLTLAAVYLARSRVVGRLRELMQSVEDE